MSRDSQAAYQAVLDSLPASKRRGFALALCVQALDLIARNSLLPTQQRIASATAECARPLIPRDVAEMFRRASERK